MIKKRIGKDLTFDWTITTNGQPLSLEGRDLTIILSNPGGDRIVLPFTCNGNTVSFRYYGKDQKRLGVYSLTLWENYGNVGQTAVDKVKAFELVANTDLENRL